MEAFYQILMEFEFKKKTSVLFLSIGTYLQTILQPFQNPFYNVLVSEMIHKLFIFLRIEMCK